MASAPLRKEQPNDRGSSPPRRPTEAPRHADSLRLVLKTEQGVRLLRLDEIACLQADGNVVVVHAANGDRHRMRVTLSHLLGELRGHGFVRVHRGVAVRTAVIVAVEKGRYRKAFVVLSNGMRVEIGRAEFHILRDLWRPGVLDLQNLGSLLLLPGA